MAAISMSDLGLPTAIKADVLVTAGELVGEDVEMYQWALLPPESQRLLALARLGAKEAVVVMTIAPGVESKEQAIAEVQAGTPLGRLLVEMEGNQVTAVLRALSRCVK